MDEEFWLSRWRSGDIGFHQPDGHDFLKKHWPGVRVPSGATVFVPLAGKSVDMRWLAAAGHRVAGVEFSELAVDQFFATYEAVPIVTSDGPFIVKSAGLITLFVGDYFALDARRLGDISAAYDRAALIALPREMRARYASHLAALLPLGAPVLLISVSYPESEIAGPPFSVENAEIEQICAPAFDIKRIETRDALARSANLKARGLTRLEETAYLLRRRE